MKKAILFLFLVSFNHFAYSQSFDIKTFKVLKKANAKEFVIYAKSVHLTVEKDTAAKAIFAKAKKCVYIKPIGTKSDNAGYSFVMGVSTQDKKNNKLILKNATEDPNVKGTWTEGDYVYIEWDAENPVSKEMWYKVLVYKKK